jgi:hypothetical protein
MAPPSRRWTQRVSTGPNTLDVDPAAFDLADPREIAVALKRAAEKHPQGDPFHVALSAIALYLGHNGDSLSAEHRRRIDYAKVELLDLFKHA